MEGRRKTGREIRGREDLRFCESFVDGGTVLWMMTFYCVCYPIDIANKNFKQVQDDLEHNAKTTPKCRSGIKKKGTH